MQKAPSFCVSHAWEEVLSGVDHSSRDGDELPTEPLGILTGDRGYGQPAESDLSFTKKTLD